MLKQCAEAESKGTRSDTDDIVHPGGEKIATPPPTPEHSKPEYSRNLVLEDEVIKTYSVHLILPVLPLSLLPIAI